MVSIYTLYNVHRSSETDSDGVVESSDEDGIEIEGGSSRPAGGVNVEDLEWFPYQSKLHMLLSVLHSSKTHRVVSEVIDSNDYICNIISSTQYT